MNHGTTPEDSLARAFRGFERAASSLEQRHSALKDRVATLESELLEANGRLEVVLAEGGRRRRLEALGRMAAELAHEVRNPLGSIRLFAAMLREDLEAEPQKSAMADQILAATAGLETTVSNLLAFASPARGTSHEVDVAELAREVCQLLAPACSVRGVRLGGPPAEATCAIEADPEGIRQVLLNLLGNALAATGEGGDISIDVQRSADAAVMRVTDNGKGIAPADLLRVFDPFFTRTEGGTGLGLSIVHGIVERHDGRIRLDSRIGEGTSAHVELAREAADAKRGGRPCVIVF